jgi:hypothetical protein
MTAATARGGQTAGYGRANRLDRLAAWPGGAAGQHPAIPVPTSTLVPPPARWRQRWAVALPLAASLAMVPWILGLAASLPDRYVTNHWNVTWVGFDILELVSFAVTSWTAWRRCPAAPAATVVSVTLLACDAWFNMTTISTTADLIAGVVTAAAGLPYAVALLYLRQSRRNPGPHGGPQERARFAEVPLANPSLRDAGLGSCVGGCGRLAEPASHS